MSPGAREANNPRCTGETTDYPPIATVPQHRRRGTHAIPQQLWTRHRETSEVGELVRYGVASRGVLSHTRTTRPTSTKAMDAISLQNRGLRRRETPTAVRVVHHAMGKRGCLSRSQMRRLVVMEATYPWGAVQALAHTSSDMERYVTSLLLHSLIFIPR